ncbi:MAG: putative glycosyltransferase [Chloroflexi bacterium]|nr:putative glycosyltransferase [Chloroflexota bacterium]
MTTIERESTTVVSTATDTRRGAGHQMQAAPQHVCVVGPSTRFLSGITYHSYSTSRALSAHFKVSTVFMRQLLPAMLYPGKNRVGAAISNLELPDTIERFDGVDWYWWPTLFRALRFLARRRPDVLILQWWTGAVLHTYLVLAATARLLGARVIIEFHEVQDPGEASVAWASKYVDLVAPWLFRLACGYTAHSEHDRKLIADRYGLACYPSTVVPVGTYDNYRKGKRWREAPDECCNLLYFGVIRPYKGVDDLIRAFNAIPPHEINLYWLTVVGETWERWELPGELIDRSPYRNRITFINRYVSDDEVEAIFGGADVVVLPYKRASQSGPLHVAMNYGLPVVVTAVGGLVESVTTYGYQNTVVTEPADPEALVAAIRKAARLRGQQGGAVPGWSLTAERYRDFLESLQQLSYERRHKMTVRSR